MKERSPFGHERLTELLGDRAVVGLDASEQADLENLLREYPGEDPHGFDLAAAGLELALMRGKIRPMPAGLAARIEANATAPTNVTSLRPPAARQRKSGGMSVAKWSGWLAAAACLALAVGSWVWRAPGARTTTATVEKSAVEQRAELLTRAGTQRIDWKKTNDPSATAASGDVVFSVAEQRGYMRFRGLAPNDRGKQQYQLWIFDKAQDERFPIDGGVFDVDPATGDVVVPIHAKLRVTDPTLFAVTVEKPGGVVVSKRDRIVLTAASS